MHQKINELKGQSERLNYPFSHGESSHIVLYRDMQRGIWKMGADISAEDSVIWVMIIRQ